MQVPTRHTIADQVLWLSPQRAIYWENEKSLILADLHIGKTGHFRKAGIGVPQSIFKEDMQRLLALVQFFKPDRLLVVGDMFHSEANKELNLFSRWRKDIASITIELIKGNHDILSENWYAENHIILHPNILDIGGFRFQHEPAGELSTQFTFAGHLHPGVSIKGLAKQHLQFPCFHFSTQQCTLPAFSLFTGYVVVHKLKGHTIYAIVHDSLVKV